MKLPDGAGSITFESVEEWASFQITRQPASGWALTGAVAAIIGLAGSLFIQRRRVWVRAVRGRTVSPSSRWRAWDAVSPRSSPRS